jgi:hypothetical protein
MVRTRVCIHSNIHVLTPLFSFSSLPAFPTFLLAMGTAFGIILRFGPGAFTFLYERWVGFVTAAFLMSVAQATFVYIASFAPGKLLALGGNSGNVIYDVRAYGGLGLR